MRSKKARASLRMPAKAQSPKPPQQPSAEYVDQLIAGQMGSGQIGGAQAPPLQAPPRYPQGFPQQQPVQQQQAATREKGKPPEPEELSQQQIEWELQTLEDQRRSLEGDKETGETGRKEQLEKHFDAKKDEVSKKQDEINQNKISFIRVIIGYLFALGIDAWGVIGWATGIEEAITASVVGAVIEAAIDLSINLFIFPIIMGKDYQKGLAFLDMVPGLDILPWYMFAIYKTRKIQKQEIKEVEDSQLKPLTEQLDSLKEELDNTEKELANVKERENKLQGIAEAQPAQAAGGKMTIRAGSGKGWIASRAMSRGAFTFKRAMKGGINIVTIMLFIVAFGYGMTYAMPKALAAYQSGEAKQSAIVSVEKGKEGFAGIAQEFKRSWQRNTQIATGEYIQGDVDKTTKEFVGIQYKPPLLPNPKKILQGEPAEFSTRLHGFGNKHSMTASTTCSLKDRELFSVTTTAGETKIDRDPGVQQIITPEQVKDQLSFTEDVTCYPKITACGNYRITYSTQVDSMRTDAFLQNNFIQKKVLRDRLEAYAKEKQISLDDEGAVNSAIRSIWPELSSSISISDKGPVKLLLLTEKLPLIGIDENTNLKLKVGVENTIDGWIKKIDTVSVTIPEGFRVSSGESVSGQSLCPSWIQSGQTLSLSPQYLQTIQESLAGVDKSLQKVFPSCHITLDQSSAAFIVENEPTPATFTASVIYSYVIQERNDLEVLYPNGTRCEKKKVPVKAAAVTSNNASNASSTTTPAPSTA
ncbi:hypothetical protein HY772_07320 [Candidatus Woesearchaeota archaeon]|nr:hypothetical protein [Candidatus Woesearchaeota archaeon]